MLSSLNVGHWLILLLLAGIIPGTNTSLSPIDMMAANATAITIIVLVITLWPRIASVLFITMPVAKKHVSRRRTA
jgi:hypothetical protein